MVFVVDDDSDRPTVTVANVSANEGGSLVWTLRISEAPVLDTIVHWSIAGSGTHRPAHGSEYFGDLSGTFTFEDECQPNPRLLLMAHFLILGMSLMKR